MRLPYIFIGLLICLFSCTKESGLRSDQVDHFIFGYFAGECIGNCVHYYLVKDGELYEDNLDWGFPDLEDFTSLPYHEEDFKRAEDLIDEFPQVLLDSDKEVYGCPDCADQGGIYLEIKDDQGKRSWHLDTDDADLPDELIEFRNNVLIVLDELKN